MKEVITVFARYICNTVDRIITVISVYALERDILFIIDQPDPGFKVISQNLETSEGS